MVEANPMLEAVRSARQAGHAPGQYAGDYGN